jgi:LysM repeat protein
MARRSPARLLAPLALVGFVIALILVINGAGSGDGSSDKSGSQVTATATATPGRKGKGGRKQRTRYTVKPGDTPSGIAEKTDVPLSQILELNPDLDDQTLTVGDRIKLRP